MLVGHSYGGLLVRLFAGWHSDQVAGVVLLDSAHPEQARRLARAVSHTHLAPRLRGTFALPFVADGVALRRSFALARPVTTLLDIPLVVITAGQAEPGNTLPPAVLRVVATTWFELQDELASLSTDHVHAVALYSDHFVQAVGGQPDLVVRAVQTVVHAARVHSPLPSCGQTFGALRGVRCRD